METEDPAIITKSLVNDYDNFIAKLSSDEPNSDVLNAKHQSPKLAPSFANIVQTRARQPNKEIAGIKFTKPSLNLQYRRVEKGESYKTNDVQPTVGFEKTKLPKPKRFTSNVPKPSVILQNSFSSLYPDGEEAEQPQVTKNDADLVVNMSDSEESVMDIEVTDVQRTGLQFMWNQKPKGKVSLLKKIDRIMANLGFTD
nr:hypothetical protein [Tanacetum cinerariifolium]